MHIKATAIRVKLNSKNFEQPEMIGLGVMTLCMQRTLSHAPHLNDISLLSPCPAAVDFCVFFSRLPWCLISSISD